LEIQTLRRTRSKKVARRETSGSSRASFRALKERKNFFPRLQRGKSIADLFQTFHVWLLSQCHFVAENNFQTVSKGKSVVRCPLSVALLFAIQVYLKRSS
jgi:hypothetical protein